MDPLSAATSFATIVGLLSNFKSEQSGTELSDFINWLQEKRLDDIALNIEHNQLLSIQLKSILSINHMELVQRLDSLDTVLSSVAMNIDLFDSLAKAIKPNSILSDQAISIVKQLVESGAPEFWEQKYLGPGGSRFLFIGGTSDGQLQILEPRFLDDDLNTLIELGFLRSNYGSNGTKKFIITRLAMRLIESN